MKKSIALFACFVALQGAAQNTDWFVSFSCNAVMGGPAPSIKKQMISQGFDQTVSYNFLWTGTVDYPVKEKVPLCC